MHTIRKETHAVSVWALGLLALFGAVVLTDAASLSSGRSGQPLSGQPRAGDYQFIFTGDTTDGRGNAKGMLGFAVTESGIKWVREGGSITSNTPEIPIGTVSMYHLRYPALLAKLPLVSEREWHAQWLGYQSVTKVSIDPAAQVLAAGTFSDCIVIETEISEGETVKPDDNQSVINSTCGTRTLWLARGVGIVHIIYAHRDGTTSEMSLTDYSIGGETQEYLPTVHEAKWSYLLKNDAFKEGVKEDWILSSEQEVGHRPFKDLFPQPEDGQSFPQKETGETEGAYQIRVRHYVEVYDEVSKTRHRSGESQAAYEARMRSYVHTRLAHESAPSPQNFKRAGESEVAYQARLRAGARNRTLARQKGTLAESKPPVTVAKRAGESEAAYQARLRGRAKIHSH